MPPRHRVAIYVRQSDSGQETSLLSFARSQPGDWQIVKVYTGNGHTSAARDGARIERDARNGVFDTLLVHSLDRLSRNLRDLAWLLKSLGDAGVTIRCATEPFDSSTSVGRQFVVMLGVSAEMQRAMRRRVSTAKSRRAATSPGRRNG